MNFDSIRFGSQIAAAAAVHHIDPRLLAAVAAQETGGPGARSGNNIVGDGGHGRGVFQIDDRFWGFAKTAAAMDPAKNASFAAGIIADNLRRFGGDVKAALSAYNAGSPTATGTTTTWADGRTLGYADSVLRHFENLGDPAATAQLASDNGENVASVNALANVYASAPPPAAAPMPVSPQSHLGSTAQLTPLHPWTQLSQAGQAMSQAADTALAALIDGDGPETPGGVA